MEGCCAVEREVDRVLTKFNTTQQNIESSIEDQIQQLERLQREISESGGDESTISPLQVALVKQAASKVTDCVTKIATEHRELHSSVSKVGKAVDRNFVADFDSTAREEVFSGPNKERLLSEVILQHFYRQGQLDISSTLAREAGVDAPIEQRQPFLEVNRILDAIRDRNIEPALDWARTNREALNLRGTTLKFSKSGVLQKSSLELKLHKLKFVELLRAGNKLAAITYARQNFPAFVDGQEKEVQGLMCAVMYAGPGLAESPYGHLLDPSHWTDIGELFLRDACALLGLSVESPLAVAVNAGCVALPALLKIKQAMQQRQVPGVWNTEKEELPIEIDLGGECRYHSVFACPILKQQVSDTNPPMRLTCGHVISRDALAKLSQGHKLKCPYCPVEQNPADARQIFF